MGVQIANIVDRLTDERQAVIYRIAIDMLFAQEQDFDHFTLTEIQEIEKAQERIAQGDCLTFSGVDDWKASFAR